MKILLGLPEYPPHHIGGGGEVFKNLAEQYRKLGHKVVSIFLWAKSDNTSIIIKEDKPFSFFKNDYQSGVWTA